MSEYAPPDPLPPPLPIFNNVNWIIADVMGGGGGGGGNIAGPQGPFGPTGAQGSQGISGIGTQGILGTQGNQGPAGIANVLRYDIAGGLCPFPSDVTMTELAFTQYRETIGSGGVRLAMQFTDAFLNAITSGYPGPASSCYVVTGLSQGLAGPLNLNGFIRIYCTQISGSNFTYLLTSKETTVLNEQAPFVPICGAFTSTVGRVGGVRIGLFNGVSFQPTPGTLAGRLAISGFS